MSQYTNERASIMNAYKKTVEDWMIRGGKRRFAEVIPFFEDGVVDEVTWFKEDNDFRPLFIMKEPSTGIIGDNEEIIIKQLEDYIDVWGSCYDHTCEEYGDIRIGRYPTWMRTAKYAKALDLESNNKYGFKGCNGNAFDFCYKVGEANTNLELISKIEDYFKKYPKCGTNKYKYKTSNNNYVETIKKIAVINIKKFGSGRYTNTKLSEMGYSFYEYLNNKDVCKIIREQIIMMDPTIIIVCGKGMLDYVDKFLNLSDFSYSKDGHRVVCIESYHPSYVKSDEDHCKYLIDNYRKSKYYL